MSRPASAVLVDVLSSLQRPAEEHKQTVLRALEQPLAKDIGAKLNFHLAQIKYTEKDVAGAVDSLLLCRGLLTEKKNTDLYYLASCVLIGLLAKHDKEKMACVVAKETLQTTEENKNAFWAARTFLFLSRLKLKKVVGSAKTEWTKKLRGAVFMLTARALALENSPAVPREEKIHLFNPVSVFELIGYFQVLLYLLQSGRYILLVKEIESISEAIGKKEPSSEKNTMLKIKENHLTILYASALSVSSPREALRVLLRTKKKSPGGEISRISAEIGAPTDGKKEPLSAAFACLREGKTTEAISLFRKTESETQKDSLAHEIAKAQLSLLETPFKSFNYILSEKTDNKNILAHFCIVASVSFLRNNMKDAAKKTLHAALKIANNETGNPIHKWMCALLLSQVFGSLSPGIAERLDQIIHKYASTPIAKILREVYTGTPTLLSSCKTESGCSF
ncbi:MAG: uncharacterized protein A8A55_1236 [Amphiamblys sp. WSBS2006]|nr:MAG: uncharacterized protein A8A55_1236 [Amphiamblys sp. WSBS2006]